MMQVHAKWLCLIFFKTALIFASAEASTKNKKPRLVRGFFIAQTKL
jgi:hypothetical protein